MAKYYPINLKIQGSKCVVIGGGSVAWRKVCSLKEAGGRVVVVSPEFCQEMEKETGIELIKQTYDEHFLDGAMIAIASTNDASVNEKIYRDAVKRNVLVNIVDKPAYCTFIVPSSIKRGELCITVSTGGASPAFSKNIRKYLEQQFGEEFGVFAQLLSEMRQKVLTEVKDESVRRIILQRIADLGFLEVIKEKGITDAKKKMAEIVDEEKLKK